MERIVDIALILVGCVLSLTASGGLVPVDAAPAAAPVLCLLPAVIAVFGCEWASTRWRVLGPLTYCALAACVSDGLYMLPAIVYELCRFVHEPLPWRVAPLAVLVPVVSAVAVSRVPAAALSIVAVLTALAALVSLRTSALLAQRSLCHRTRDDLRGRELSSADGRVWGGVERMGRAGVQVAGADARRGGAGASGAGPDGSCVAGLDARLQATYVGVAAPAAPPVPTNHEDRCRAAFSRLTDREYEVVRLIAEGLDNHEIAAAAFISEGTVRNRISSALQKTDCKNRTQLAVAWWRAREG